MQYKPGNWVTGFKRSPRAANVQHRDMGLFLNSSGKFEPIDDSWDNLHSGGLFISDDNKLYFRDETNKDIYINSPAAETLGLSAGNATTAGFVTINEEGFDTDFRVEASGVTHALFVQGSDGNVGIGTAPSKRLHVKGLASNYGTIQIESTSDAHGAEIIFGDGVDPDYGDIVQFATSAGEGGRMRFRAGAIETMNLRGGNMGIGTNNPGTLLELFGTAPYLTLRNSTHENTDGGRESKIIFEGEKTDGSDSTLAVIQASHDGTSDDQKGDLIFSTNDGNDAAAPTEAMRIDSAGNVGIGQPNPSTRQLQTLASSTNGLRVENSTNDVIVDVLAATSQAWVGTISAHDLVLLAEGTSTLTIGTSGDCTIANGNLVIGTAGKGIDFSAQTATSASGATTTSELLDHYEEGTCSLIVTGVGTTGSATAQLMSYQRVGNTVTVRGYITQTPTSAAGQVRITGLPFTAAASSGSGTSTLSGNAIATTATNLVDFTAGKIPFLYVEGNTAYLDGLEMTDDGSWTAWAVDTSASQAWFINISYTV
jgi:hypothetical protein